MVAEDLSWVPAGVDTGRASIARVYDYWLGGTHNLPADRDAAQALESFEPGVPALARANRGFLGRAVQFLADAGVRQFLDIGAGIPAQGSVHEIAQAAAPGAAVVYADFDPVAVAHGKSILAGNPHAAVIQGDLRDGAAILAAPEAGRLLDFSEPAGLLLAAVLHFIPDADDPWQIIGTLRDAFPSGSYVVISHACAEREPEVTTVAEKAYQRSIAQLAVRSRTAIERFFDGLELVPPGVVTLPEWRPLPGAGQPDDPAISWALAGIGRKP